MPIASLVGWIVIVTVAGFLSRKIVRTPPVAGLFGDMVVGLVGAVGLGWILQKVSVDISEYVMSLSDGLQSNAAIWVDVAIVALVGALIVRLVLKPLTEMTSG